MPNRRRPQREGPPVGDGGDESFHAIPVRPDAGLQGLAQVLDGTVPQLFKGCANAAQM